MKLVATVALATALSSPTLPQDKTIISEKDMNLIVHEGVQTSWKGSTICHTSEFGFIVDMLNQNPNQQVVVNLKGLNPDSFAKYFKAKGQLVWQKGNLIKISK